MRSHPSMQQQWTALGPNGPSTATFNNKQQLEHAIRTLRARYCVLKYFFHEFNSLSRFSAVISKVIMEAQTKCSVLQSVCFCSGIGGAAANVLHVPFIFFFSLFSDSTSNLLRFFVRLISE